MVVASFDFAFVASGVRRCVHLLSPSKLNSSRLAIQPFVEALRVLVVRIRDVNLVSGPHSFRHTVRLSSEGVLCLLCHFSGLCFEA